MRAYYEIAGHLIALITDQPFFLKEILSSYESFVKKAVEVNEEPLFVLKTGQDINRAGTLLHTFHWDDSICSIFEFSGHYVIEISHLQSGRVALMETDSHWHRIRTTVSVANEDASYFLDLFLMMGFSFATAPFKTLMMHASVIELNQQAILFLGKSGTGKSTHTALWREFIPGSRLLNDDNPVVRLTEDGVRVYGSPWSGKTACYVNRSCPVSAFVRLVQAPVNKMQLLHPAHAFAALLPSCSNMVWDKRIHGLICNTLSELVPITRVSRLECLPDKDAVSLSFALLGELNGTRLV